jgi:hypothetical protein
VDLVWRINAFVRYAVLVCLTRYCSSAERAFILLCWRFPSLRPALSRYEKICATLLLLG